MVGAQIARGFGSLKMFRLAMAGEADREGVETASQLLGRQRGDYRRIDPAGQEGAERDVADQAPRDRRSENRLQLLGQFIQGSPAPRRPSRAEFEIPLDQRAAVRVERQGAARRQ